MKSRIKVELATSKKKNGRSTWMNRLWFALCLSALLLLFVLILLPARYETNDDFAMVMELSGYSPTPVSFVLNPLTSHLLYFLYQQAPSIPWYGLFLYFCTFLGVGLTVNVFFRTGKPVILFLMGPFILVFFFRAFAFPGLTTASLLLLFAVFLQFLKLLTSSDNSASYPRGYLAILVIGLFMAFLLRWELVTYALSFAVPVILFCNNKTKSIYRPFLCSLIIIALSYPVFSLYLDSGKNRFYNQYSRLRKKFHDTDKGGYYDKVTQIALTKANWSYEDYLLFRNHWFLYDQDRFNSEKLFLFLKSNSPIENIPLITHIGYRIASALRKSIRYSAFFVLTLLLLLIAKIFHQPTERNMEIWKKHLSVSLVVIGIVFFMYYRFEPRIYLPLYIYLLGMIVILSFPEKHAENVGFSPLLKKMLISLTVIMTILTYGMAVAMGHYLLNDIKTSFQVKQYVQNQLNQPELNAVNKKDSLFVALSPLENLMIETIHPLKERKDYTDFNILPFGWQINSPQYFNILKSFKISENKPFLSWAVNNPRVIWFQLFRDIAETNRIRLIEEYFNRHIVPGRSAYFQPFFDNRNQQGIGFVFYHLVLK